MKIGIFFGGQSREREVSFAGGRTVYDNLNKNIFDPIPIFVDSLGNFILLQWQYIYKGTIRDFYPPNNTITYKEGTTPHGKSKFQIYVESLGKLTDVEFSEMVAKVGKKIYPSQFKQYFEFAFLALHGNYGEDGNIQGILEWYNMPYSGSGILPSSLGINKMIQSQVLESAGFLRPKQVIISREQWFKFSDEERKSFLKNAQDSIGNKIVVKSSCQGSSIGISIIDLLTQNNDDLIRAIEKSFFLLPIAIGGEKGWKSLTSLEKEDFLTKFTDIREGLGFPIYIDKIIGKEIQPEDREKVFFHPKDFYNFLENCSYEKIHVQALDGEAFVLLEEFIRGREFSCIVIQNENINDGKEVIALPPTEIQKYENVFDYRSKYLPGMSRKITPIDTTEDKIKEIRTACEALFKTLNCNVYARIDGFLADDGRVFLNDPNTTSGMLPSSFFFHQAAEIGLDPSQFLTYLIRTSLSERIKTGKNDFTFRKCLNDLDKKIHEEKAQNTDKIKVGVIMGGFSTERHISMESGRNIYEKLASSTKYEPYPIFLTGNEEAYELYLMPINIMLKDNADDIKDKILQYEAYKNSKGKEILDSIGKECEGIRKKYVSKSILYPEKISFEALKTLVSQVFIALHGRPGEDGSLQVQLDKYNIPFNGSSAESSKTTINKYETNELLQKEGFLVAKHALIYQAMWEKDKEAVLEKVASEFEYPIIAKPADDGCSSAVKKIKNRDELAAFAEMMFRPHAEFLAHEMKVLKLKTNEEFPQKSYFLIEELITQKDALHFLEITGGMLTHWENNSIRYEVFEPSETLALGEVLSLEEKFLAGEGQNITPAKYINDAEKNKIISQKVRDVLEKVAITLGVEGYARIDAFVRVYDDLTVEVIIIEINSLPGMTPATCIFHQSALNNYKPYNFIDAILSFAKKKKESLLNT